MTVRAVTFLACPDFKGIKTPETPGELWQLCFWPALISKGLRLPVQHGPRTKQFLACPDFKGIKTPPHGAGLFGDVRFWPALISKGLRQLLPAINEELGMFLACPDFKGIKTTVDIRSLSVGIVSGLP